jgi:exonuclease SbcD
MKTNMGLKFLHLADIHLGVGRRLSRDSSDPLDYLKRHNAQLNRYVDLADALRVDFVLIAGDIFDNATTTLEELVTAYMWLRKLGRVCPVLLTPGNHDELETGVFQTDRLARMQIPNVSVSNEPTRWVFTKEKGFRCDGGKENVGDCTVLACPWTGMKDQKKFNAWLESFYSGEEIVMLHECIGGVTTDSGFKAIKGITVPDIKGVKYYALGDIHKHQRVNLPHAVYSGSPLQLNFGEKPDKGCQVVTIDEEGNWSWKFHPVLCPIELHNITAAAEAIEQDHWYKLSCAGNQIPAVLPPNIRDVEPLPAKLEQEEAKQIQSMDQKCIQVDYLSGVAELLGVAQYDENETKATLDEISGVLKRAGFAV